ncbi:MAG TPA: tRNA (N(6)-L-threonylcarbamoyladenosine(37)-C(2))-methylthiotransferase MtaB [Bacillota bacterium]|nr:tRNA (N(6)-L-threonylcarbamoyladenosine(37)-C(2))-methylthiotransferase MtaB [Bacillota bacterium]
MRIGIHTFGCKVNQYDTEALAHLLRERGHEVTEQEEDVDVFIVNTCAVTGESERKARQYLRKIAKTNPGVRLVVTGCYSQTSPQELTEIEGVSLITGVKDRSRLVDLIENLRPAKAPAIQVDDWSDQERMDWNAADFPSKTRAFLKIEDGCSAYCSYCKIPYARGPVRSLTPQQAVKEFKRLLDLGHAEIVLTGIHLGCYGHDLGIGLEEILRAVDGFSGQYRFRLSSVEPSDFSPAVMEAIADAEHLCPHLHIPLQSGCNSVLKRMNRHYTTDDYARIVRDLRQVRPGLAVTTDVITGFPGETDEEARETFEFIESQRFSDLHVFPFSPRVGTAAFRMSGQISRRLKHQRVQALIGLAQKMATEFQREMIGKTVEVLIEEANLQGGEGLTGEYIRAWVDGEVTPGSLVAANVTDQADDRLISLLNLNTESLRPTAE